MSPRASDGSTYEPLLTHEQDAEKSYDVPLPHQRRPITWTNMFLVLSLALNVTLLWGFLLMRAQRDSMIRWRGDKPAYSEYDSCITHNPYTHTLHPS